MLRETQTTMPLAQLVEDMDLYPRHAVDSSHVQSLVHALESGAALPPIVVDKKSKRITDGWHRARAYARFLGKEAVVDVVLVAYPDEAAMIFDATQRNTSHGRRLDAIDKTRCVLMLQSAGFNGGQIAGAMHMPESRVEKLTIKIASAPKSAGGTIPGTHSIALKRCVSHLSGTKLNESQAKAHGMLPGTSFLLIAKQLCSGLTENMIDLEDERLVKQLGLLRDLLVKRV